MASGGVAATSPPGRLYALFYLCRKYAGLFLRLPLWAFLDIRRSNRPCSSWSFGRSLLVRISRYAWEIPLRSGRLLDRDITKEVPSAECMGTKFIWIDAVSEDLVQGEIQKYAQRAKVSPVRIPAYGFGEWGQDTPPLARDGEKIVMHCHGGAYVTRTAHPEDLTAGISKGIIKYSAQTISRTLSIEYRISRSAPWPASSPFPTALLDGLSGYNYLVNTLGFKPDNIILAGDSAGGNLVLALTRYIRDNPQIGLGLPGGLLLASPWCDLVGTYRDKQSNLEGNSSVKNDVKNCDYLSGDFDSAYSTVQYGVRSLLGDISIQESRNMVYINPSSLELDSGFVATMFENFPPTYIVYGGAEVLVDEIRTLYERMVMSLGPEKVVKDEVPDAIHDFVALEVWEPERGESHKRIASWLASL
ncbi:alpha/beta-hydrolase [Ceratobasidium sp. AG-I]|nr:alpha/beta-hydrolase [Ceratobasidium sp. AG-I]